MENKAEVPKEKMEIQIRIKNQSIEFIKKAVRVIPEIEKECNGHCTLLEIEY